MQVLAACHWGRHRNFGNRYQIRPPLGLPLGAWTGQIASLWA